ncbi:alpha/beta hydrolase [Marivirga tractuosa]|uniref:Alpha/beta hydrolase fold protein n=1 Tax=Marivirga tractuosa (strain ATCC 23168 / DSM 4126 / NBRC 15989 / NCIMB 1408 / VKM B-1430 / H-43) TaxID=643867 RepID=E4TRE8_MARTH|nr:alpha/beta fold hydrolase [Marivirga tractuosa]ADR20682.1 alpha/beta hydrolase fold protein [Marivirga tractuosa DSM 4126]BDD14868.1 alpha/beta hydrolase [Marivirga tractuosa]
MPVIKNSQYKPPFYLFNQHMETIFPSALRKVKGVQYERERIETRDDDFLDIDWVKNGNSRLIIASHGLEGSSDRPYIMGIAKLFSQNKWDVLAWNCRSCSGEMNRREFLYHHGFTQDVEEVVQKALKEGYKEIVMIGFSMGGSLTLKYVGENGKDLYPEIKGAMAVSVPCNLSSSSRMLALKKNKFYQNRFMRKLDVKLREKNEQYPNLIHIKPWQSFADFHEFDTHYSAKIFGYKDAQDFYDNVQCFPHLKKIAIPTLILNSLNDPMLTGDCYPESEAERNGNIELELTKHGGHVGFLQKGKPYTYAEERALSFFTKTLNEL